MIDHNLKLKIDTEGVHINPARLYVKSVPPGSFSHTSFFPSAETLTFWKRVVKCVNACSGDKNPKKRKRDSQK